MTIAPERLHAWLAGRSIARELPPPVAEDGGFRIDTGSTTETCRWVFPKGCDGLVALAKRIEAPGFALKLCDTVDALQALLPSHWQGEAPCWVMARDGAGHRRTASAGYRIALEHGSDRRIARIFDAAGEPAASGYVGIAEGAMVFDRIVGQPEHRRRGLGATLMGALDDDAWPGERLLVATEEGRALYEALGWRVLAPYASASIPR